MRYGVLTLLCLATVIAYVHRSAISIPSKRIEAELGLDPKDMGLVMGTWYWAYAVLITSGAAAGTLIGCGDPATVTPTDWSDDRPKTLASGVVDGSE